ncbi:TetR/AcrR family transcriptional regulator [Ileibacterium valens]|uniref:TetR/AcrR family transcriptional regulator n=1 Tax=Ileibacterium valens TaxID=1862668 RepID=UPI00272C4B80|nr:TetR/AcrR family transcriptional regulator [Ileibacterium valens]
MPSKVIQNKEQKKEKLLEAAFFLFTRKDINEVSISEIAREAGIAKGTFYLYFKDKYDLRDFLIFTHSKKILEKAIEALDQSQILSFEDSVIFIISDIERQLQQQPLLLTFIKYNLPLALFSSHLSSSIKDDRYSLKHLFVERANQSGYRFENPEAVLFMILELTTSVFYQTMINQIPCSFAEIRPSFYQAIRAILSIGHPEKA